MNNIHPITDAIYWIGTNDTTTTLFEQLWPLPHGVSYNSYLIRDTHSAIIDLSAHHTATEFLDNVSAALNDGASPEYLIINHMEPDHTGAIHEALQRFPNIKIVGNKRTFDLLKDLYGIDQNLHLVKDGDTLSLGTHTLQFHLTPMLHWPETMMTYEQSTGTLFSGDAFGSFGALQNGIFDNEVDHALFEDEMLRYYLQHRWQIQPHGGKKH